MGSNKKQNEDMAMKSIMRPIATFAGVGLLFSMMLLTLFAGILSGKDFPKSFIDIFAIIAMFIGSFLGGFMSSKKIKKRGAFVGSLNGLCVFIVVFIIGMIFSPFNFKNIFIKFLIIIFSSMIGGIFGVNTKKKQKF